MARWRTLLFLLGLGGLFVAIPRVLTQGNVEQARLDRSAPDSQTEAAMPTSPSKSNRRSISPIAESTARFLAALRSTDPAEHTLALDTLLPELIRRDAYRAMDLLTALEPWERREQAMLIASKELAVDPAVAIFWLNLKVQDEAEKKICRAAACRQMMSKLPQIALGIAKPDPGLVEELAAAYVTRSPEEALKWIAEQPETEGKDRLWAAGIRALAEKSPEQAARLAVEKIGDALLQEEAVISALHQWVLQDRAAAATWVDLFPEGSLRDRAEGELSGTR